MNTAGWRGCLVQGRSIQGATGGGQRDGTGSAGELLSCRDFSPLVNSFTSGADFQGLDRTFRRSAPIRLAFGPSRRASHDLVEDKPCPYPLLRQGREPSRSGIYHPKTYRYRPKTEIKWAGQIRTEIAWRTLLNSMRSCGPTRSPSTWSCIATSQRRTKRSTSCSRTAPRPGERGLRRAI